MVGVKKPDLSASEMSAENSAANDDSFESGDEAQGGSGNEASDESGVNVQSEDGLAKGLADCSITPEKAAARLKSTDQSEEESFSDEEMPEEEPSKVKASKQPGDKAASGRPKFSDMILEAMAEAEPSRSGVSAQQIKKLVHQKYPGLGNNSDTYIKGALKRLLDNEMLIQVTGTGASGSFKLTKPEKTKPGPKSKPTTATTKTASKAGPKSATAAAKSTETKKASAKSPMRKAGGSGAKVGTSKTTGPALKTAKVTLQKLGASKAKNSTVKSPLRSNTDAGTAKPRGRPTNRADENVDPKSPGSKSKSAVAKPSALSKASSTKVKAAASAKSPGRPKTLAAKSPKAKTVAPKSPKPKTVAPKSPKPKTVAPKSPVAQRAPASKSKLESASDDVAKVAPGPASKRGKKL